MMIRSANSNLTACTLRPLDADAEVRRLRTHAVATRLRQYHSCKGKAPSLRTVGAGSPQPDWLPPVWLNKLRGGLLAVGMAVTCLAGTAVYYRNTVAFDKHLQLAAHDAALRQVIISIDGGSFNSQAEAIFREPVTLPKVSQDRQANALPAVDDSCANQNWASMAQPPAAAKHWCPVQPLKSKGVK